MSDDPSYDGADNGQDSDDYSDDPILSLEEDKATNQRKKTPKEKTPTKKSPPVKNPSSKKKAPGRPPKYVFSEEDKALVLEGVKEHGVSAHNTIKQHYFADNADVTAAMIKRLLTSDEMAEEKAAACFGMYSPTPVYIYPVAHKSLKERSKRKFIEGLAKADAMNNFNKKAKTATNTSPSSSTTVPTTPLSAAAAEPWLVPLPDGSGLHIFFRHDLGTTVCPRLDETNHVVTLIATVKSYLVPEEFRRTDFWLKVPKWDGSFTNYGREQILQYSIQVDPEINLEESSIQRKDYATCYGLLAEFIFTKKIRNGAHLKPTLTWDILDEGTKHGRGFNETLEARVAANHEQRIAATTL